MGKESLTKSTNVDPNPSQMAKQDVFEQKVNPDVTSSLFDEEVSEAELMGDESTSEKDPDPEGSSGEPEPEPKEKPKDGPKEEPEEDPKEALKKEPEADPGKPQKGFVSIKALHEERHARQNLQEEVQELRDALDARDDGYEDFDPNSTPAENFTVLTEEEYDTLTSEDPIAAMQYKLDLRDYKETQHHVKVNAQAIKDNIRSGFEKVLDALPDLADDDNTIADDIEAFAEGHDIDSNVFLEMANPGTMIVDGSGRQRPLGTDAADFLLLLYKTMSAEEKMKSTLEVDIRKTVEAELVEKFKQKQTNFTSLEDAPLSSEAPEGGLTEFTEDSFRKLTEAEREEALRGS